MDSSKLAIKYFFANPGSVHLESFVPVFHNWIQKQSIPGYLLIDVADYKHVPEGPGIVLVAHEANFSIDQDAGKPGLLYYRKRPFGTNFAERLRETFKAALTAAHQIETAESLKGKAQFCTGDFVFQIYDRLLAPHQQSTLEAIKPELTKQLNKLYPGATPTIDLIGHPKQMFQARVQVKTTDSPEKILSRV